MRQGVSWFVLLVILIDNKAKAYISLEEKPPPVARQSMLARGRGGHTAIEVAGDIGISSDFKTIGKVPVLQVQECPVIKFEIWHKTPGVLES
ncbi:unnamed protein product [marine sediment metagenome]|uniref:Uncharacterized protein n=1 Tax=marine sediment metagenome TaxID=412755 RepID=X1PZ56_9ZZZZ